MEERTNGDYVLYDDAQAEIKLLENNYKVAAENEQSLKDECKRLRDALEAWAEMDKESADIHPCPDYVLRNQLRIKARTLTAAALVGKEKA